MYEDFYTEKTGYEKNVTRQQASRPTETGCNCYRKATAKVKGRETACLQDSLKYGIYCFTLQHTDTSRMKAVTNL